MKINSRPAPGAMSYLTNMLIAVGVPAEHLEKIAHVRIKGSGKGHALVSVTHVSGVGFTELTYETTDYFMG